MRLVSSETGSIASGRFTWAGSAWAFERGWLSIYQLLAGKPQRDEQLRYPLTREHVYGERSLEERNVL